MARVTVAVRQAGGGSGILDRLAARYPRGAPGRGGTLSAGPDRVGPILPAFRQAAAATCGGQEVCTAESEVMLGRLWFELSPEARARFGGCFSQMVLKVLRGPEGCVAEDPA